MANSENPLASLARRANDALLAPFIVGPNVGLAAINATIGGTARISELTARAAGTAGVPFAGLVEDFSRTVADTTLSAAEKSVQLAADATQKVTGGGSERTANDLLARTLLDQGTQTAALPLTATLQATLAALDTEPFRRQAWEAWLVFSRSLDTLSIKGVIPGRVGAETDAETRFGFYFMTTEGPLGAVLRDLRGIIGGFLALGLGDFQWLAEALPHYWESMEYVYDKKLHDEVQPESDFPIGATLAADAAATIQRFPWNFTQALQGGDPLAVLRSSIEDFGLISTLVARYPRVEFNVVYDVVRYVARAWIETGDAQNYALCELAVMESTLSDERKGEAFSMLRKTANYNTVEFEFYVPLLVPLDGTPADQVHRSGAAGNPIPDTAIANSVFNQAAIDRAQAINSELFSLRSFLWLYRDKAIARQKNHEQTVMKFGREAAERIEQNPLYPLTPAEEEALVRGGPRPCQEVNEIFFRQLRKRGLEYVSDIVATHLPGGLPGGVTRPAVELPETPPPPSA